MRTHQNRHFWTLKSRRNLRQIDFRVRAGWSLGKLNAISLNTGQGNGDSVTKDDLIQELDRIITVIDQSDENMEGEAS